MNIFEYLTDAFSFLEPRVDRDRSIVGKSQIEEGASRFWRRLGFTLLLAAGTAALVVWVL